MFPHTYVPACAHIYYILVVNKVHNLALEELCLSMKLTVLLLNLIPHGDSDMDIVIWT